MRINLEQPDVEKAIALYLKSIGVTAPVSEIKFKAGRGDSGMSTTITVSDPQPRSEDTVPSRGAQEPAEEPKEPDAPEAPEANEEVDDTSEEESPATNADEEQSSESLFS